MRAKLNTQFMLYQNILYKHKHSSSVQIISAQTGCGIIQNLGSSVVKPRCSVLFPKITFTRLIRSNHLRDLHGLVLAGRYFWVQNLGSSGVKPRCSVLFPKITLTRLIRSNHLRDLHGLVLAGRYFWVQNLGSSVLYNKLNLYIVGFFLFWN